MTHVHFPPAREISVMNAVQPAVVQLYCAHGVCGLIGPHDNLKAEKKAIFHLLNLTILNSFITYASCGSKLPHWSLRLLLDRDVTHEAVSASTSNLMTRKTSSS